MRSIANPAKQLPITQASSSNQPINFDTISFSKYGSSEPARCDSAAMLSDSDLTDGGVGAGAWPVLVAGGSWGFLVSIGRGSS